MFGALRRFFRKNMPPMEVEQARSSKAKLSLLYVVLAWNTIGVTVYWVLKENLPRTPIDSVDYAKILGVHDATVIKYSGLTKVKEYDIHLKDQDIEEFYTKSETTEAKGPSENKNTTLME